MLFQCLVFDLLTFLESLRIQFLVVCMLLFEHMREDREEVEDNLECELDSMVLFQLEGFEEVFELDWNLKVEQQVLCHEKHISII